MAQFALRWILMFDAVTLAIPGAKDPKQALVNAKAADMPPLSDETMENIQALYNERIRPLVHQRW
jgi:aryl-alcohol dehydrogenase-like predicted oxidoreductase